MHNQKAPNSLIVFIILLSSSITVYGQFSAKMYYTTAEKNGEYQIYSDGNNYRYEFNEDGQKGVVIVPDGAKEIYILMPEQNMAIKTKSNSKMSMSTDPLKQYEYWLNEGAAEQVIEKEKINGVDCIKKELRNIKKDDYGEVNQHLYTIWYSEDYKFPIKMENYIDGSGSSGMEVKDIKPWTPTTDSFIIPSGYKTMEM